MFFEIGSVVWLHKIILYFTVLALANSPLYNVTANVLEIGTDSYRFQNSSDSI